MMEQRRILHPIADETTHEYFLFDAEEKWVSLTVALLSHIEECRSAGVRPVLLTGADAVISPFVADALRFAGGSWACHTPASGVYNALSGYRLYSFPDLWGEPTEQRERLPGFGSLPAETMHGLRFEAFMRHRAEKRTQIGLTAEHLITGMGGPQHTGLDRWGWSEPLSSSWSAQRITLEMHGQMPRSERLLAAGPGGATASITVARTHDGLLEHTRGLIPLPTAHAPDASDPAVTATLRELAERSTPAIVLVSRGHLDPGGPEGRLGQRPRSRPPEEPLAVLLGATAVHDLRLDIQRFSTRHDIVPLGRSRAPSALIRFTGRDSLWHQFLAFAHDLDWERVTIAMGAPNAPKGER